MLIWTGRGLGLFTQPKENRKIGSQTESGESSIPGAGYVVMSEGYIIKIVV